jgi:DNA repair exonuclease SbcCD ATPase subunit
MVLLNDVDFETKTVSAHVELASVDSGETLDDGSAVEDGGDQDEEMSIDFMKKSIAARDRVVSSLMDQVATGDMKASELKDKLEKLQAEFEACREREEALRSKVAKLRSKIKHMKERRQRSKRLREILSESETAESEIAESEPDSTRVKLTHVRAHTRVINPFFPAQQGPATVVQEPEPTQKRRRTMKYQDAKKMSTLDLIQEREEMEKELRDATELCTTNGRRRRVVFCHKVEEIRERILVINQVLSTRGYM